MGLGAIKFVEDVLLFVRCRHRALISACVSALSERMDDVASSTEWETEWLSLDRDQLIEFIRSSELTVKDEWDLWQVRSPSLGIYKTTLCHLKNI